MNEYVKIGSAVLVGAVVPVLLAWWRLRSEGVTAVNAAQIADGAALRRDMMERLDQANRRIDALLARVDDLRRENDTLRRENNELHARITAFELSATHVQRPG